MSVISSPVSKPRRWLHLWPLALFLLLAVGGALWLWQAWPQVMLKSILWQREVNQQMSGLLKAVAENPTKAGGGSSGVQLYLWRAACPGTGARQNRYHDLACHASIEAEIEYRPDAGILFTSGRCGDCAGRGRPFAATAAGPPAAYEQLLAGKGELRAGRRAGADPLLAGAEKLRALLRKPKFKAFTPHHVHHENCGCGHQHLPTQEQLQNGDDWRARLMIVLSMGMRPCSGAIMVLLFSKVIGVFGWGMLSALAMAAGTSLTISSLALLVHSFRQLAVKLSGNKTPVLWRQVGWTTLALAGGVILLVAAVTMWMSAVPVGRGLRPF